MPRTWWNGGAKVGTLVASAVRRGLYVRVEANPLPKANRYYARVVWHATGKMVEGIATNDATLALTRALDTAKRDGWPIDRKGFSGVTDHE